MISLNDDHLTVEWQHVAGARGTCGRCTETGEALDTLREELAERVGPGRAVSITETILPDDALDLSNRVLVNGTPVEELLDARLDRTACAGCGELSACCGSGEPTQCRAVVVDGEVHEALDETVLGKAIEVAADEH